MANQQTAPVIKIRTRSTTPFDEAKRAQATLVKLDERREEVMAGLSEEAAVMLNALEKLRTESAQIETSQAAE